MVKAGKKRNRRATKPPPPDEQQEAEAEAEAKAEAERLRPFVKQFQEKYERAAAETAEMVKARKDIERVIRPPSAAPASAPTQAPTPTPAPAPTPPLRWVYEEVELLKVQGVAYAGMGKQKLADKLVGRMRAAVKAGRVDKLWSVGHMRNELSERGLWPVR